MKKLFFIILLLSLTACECGKKTQTKPKEQTADEKACSIRMTNEEIVRDTKYCEANGLKGVALHCGDDITTVRIQCEPIPIGDTK